MRTIKFRGQKQTNGVWVYGDLETKLNRIHEYDNDGNYAGFVNVNPDTIGQFTGLYDKNGKEIYEGDIVKIPTKHGDDVFWIGYETSHIGAFCLCEDDDCNSRFVSIFGRNYDYEPFDCEVIGNIHDNLKLLENEKD